MSKRTKQNPVKAKEEKYLILNSEYWKIHKKKIMNQFPSSEKLIIKESDGIVIVCPIEEIDALRYDAIAEGLSDDFLENGRNQPNIQDKEVSF